MLQKRRGLLSSGFKAVAVDKRNEERIVNLDNVNMYHGYVIGEYYCHSNWQRHLISYICQESPARHVLMLVADLACQIQSAAITICGFCECPRTGQFLIHIIHMWYKCKYIWHVVQCGGHICASTLGPYPHLACSLCALYLQCGSHICSVIYAKQWMKLGVAT